MTMMLSEGAFDDGRRGNTILPRNIVPFTGESELIAYPNHSIHLKHSSRTERARIRRLQFYVLTILLLPLLSKWRTR